MKNNNKHKRKNKTKSWFFKKINKTDIPLTRLIKEKGRINIDNIGIGKVYIKDLNNYKWHYIKLYSSKFENLGKKHGSSGAKINWTRSVE